MKTILLGGSGQSFREGLLATLGPQHTLVNLDADADTAAYRAAFEGASAVVSNRYDHTFPEAPTLRLVQVTGVGTDDIVREALPAAVTLANVSGHGPAVAEYVVGALLAQRIGLCEAASAFKKGDWSRSSRMGGAPSGELHGKRVGILGYGLIGREVATRLRPFGVSIAVCNRTAPAESPLYDRAFSLENFPAMAAECDILVVATALTEATRGLVGARVFEALPAGATIVNVARGPVVDEDALHDALDAGRLGAAIIDVWYNYPAGPGDGAAKPSRHDFGRFENVMMTPHISGWSEGTLQRRVEEIAENLQRLERGEPLLNVLKAGT